MKNQLCDVIEMEGSTSYEDMGEKILYMKGLNLEQLGGSLLLKVTDFGKTLSEKKFLLTIGARKK